MKINYDEKRKRRYPKFIWILLCAFMCLSNAYSQKTITGKVTDSHQEALAGVSVVLKGATVGTFTDIDGAYKITVPSGDASLEFSFLGFKPQTVIVGNRSEINITLVENLKELDEVVVVGYGVQKRAHLTGSVSQITSEDIVKAPMQNVSNMLTGKLPGLTSLQRSGKPGDDGATFYVRGLNSFAGGNGPMIVVDGVPRTIDNLNPNDIESVSVLKDAAASVYGIQGANGVILITTKSGSEGPAKIFYDGSMTWTANTAMPEYLNARDYMYWHNKARQMDGLDPLWTAGIQNKVMSDDPNSIFGQTDWLDKIFRTGITQQHNISASGATERVKYYASIGFMNQEGTLINTDLKRYNVRTNLDIQVAKNLKFSIGLSGDRRDRHWPGTAIGNQTEFSPIRQAIAAIPIFKSEYDGMNVAWNNGTYNNNGYAALTESGWKNNTQWQLNSNYKLEYDLSGLTDVLKGLKASVFAAYNYSNTTDDNYDRYYEVYSINGNFDQGVSGASGYTKGNSYSKSASWGDTWMLRPQFDYSREFGKHSISATLLFETKKSYSNTMTGAARGFYSDVAVDISMGLLSLPKGWQAVTGSHKYSDGTASYVGRLNYVFDKKYLAEVVVRRDGSYVFAPENRWGTFPMASAGWVVSEEEFFSNAFPNVDFFKIRASVGTAGNMY
ncbi:SusC/RagA family TonB-linked outer membrane protein [Dysgonomonas sp. GY75]|uniref:SusC/RagA family TonB-linked outer membrane protein n=1 Tax=Dysgonomonas sp. GY75 TaxID=2780419 RepID=UPI001F5501DB|nr:SusC/RagA family TonB-linked outer membrane protein [Dysgonomonas sp. GY75]